MDLDSALDLDSSLALAHATLAKIHAFNWRGREARETYERAYQLSPNDPSILMAYADFDAVSNRPAHAAGLVQRAMELDPISSNGLLRGLVFEFGGNLVAAAISYRESLESNPQISNIQTHLALVEIMLGNDAEAERELRRAETLLFDVTIGPILVKVEYGYSRLGLHEDAERPLRQFEELVAEQRESAANWVIYNLARGDEEEAFRWLQRVAERAPYEGYYNVHAIKVNLWNDPVLNRPEFAELRSQLTYTDL